MPKLRMTETQTQEAAGFAERRKEVEERRIDGLGNVPEIQGEIDEIIGHVKEFCNLEPDEVMRLCSGYQSRLTEIRIRIQRIEEYLPVWKRVRTQEVEPLIDELKQQFNISSRIITVRQLDWDMQRGM